MSTSFFSILSIMRLLHEGDLRCCYRNSGSVTYLSTLPSSLVGLGALRAPCPHPQALHLVLRAKSRHIRSKCVRMALCATFSNSLKVSQSPHHAEYRMRLKFDVGAQ